MTGAIAAAKVEADVGEVTRETPVAWSVTGFVAWDPAAQEWTVTGLKVVATHYLGKEDEVDVDLGGELPDEAWRIVAAENLISRAEADVKGLGRCVGCANSGYPANTWAMADGADWMCRECRGAVVTTTTEVASHG